MFYPLIMTVKMWILLWGGTQVFARLLGKHDADFVKGKPLWIMMGYYAVGMMGYSYWLAYLMMVVTLPALAKSRSEAAPLFLVAAGSITSLSNPLVVGSTYLLFIDKWSCLSLSLFIMIFLKPRVGPKASSRFDLPFLIMLVLELVQIRNQNFTSSMRIALNVILSEGLPYFALVLSMGRRRDLRRVMLAVAYLGFMLSVVAIYEAFSRQLVYAPIDSQLHSAGLELYRLSKMRGGILRAPTSFPDSTNFAQFLVIALMATLAYRPYFKSTRLLSVALGVITLGVFVTSSRNAWIAILVSVMAFDIYQRRYLAVTGKAAAIGIMYGTLLLAAEFIPYFAAMTGNSADTSSTSSYRTMLLNRGIEEFWKNPVLGADVASIMNNMQDMKQGEGIIDFVNGYLFYSLTVGVGGLIGLVLVFLLPAFTMLRVRRAMMQRQIFMVRTAAFCFAIALNYMVCTGLTGFGGEGAMFYYLVMAISSVLFSWRTISPQTLARWDGLAESDPVPRDESPRRQRPLAAPEAAPG